MSAAVHGVAEPVDFNHDVRPLLSDRCFPCHGPDAEARKADLRLDTQEGAFADLGGTAAFLPGKPRGSEAIRRIFSADPDERMPPLDSNLRLDQEEKQLLHRWVEQGATWSTHWAFVLPTKPDFPTVKDSSWPQTAIDYFVLAGIEKAGLRPMPEADRSTLIRRVTLDLTGLPPSLDEIDRFLADISDDAYEKVVDRLLRSPAYGERIAWEWMDYARYADTDGFQGDPTRTMWPWRDWLIRALNKNMPFDQFTIEMLAGDLLPGASQDQVIATGFNRNHMHNGEGGRIPEETRVENVFDRTETTSTVWLGLTMTCARCHDHKFDPITQEEYYRLFAFFNNSSEQGNRGGGKSPPIHKYFAPGDLERKRNLDREIDQLTAFLDGPNPQIDQAQATWETNTQQVLHQLEFDSTIAFGDWSVLGPLPAPNGDGKASFDHDFGPESEKQLKRTEASDNQGWKFRPELLDGTVHALPTTVGATYLKRSVNSPGNRTLTLSLGSDDAIKVWLNGKVVLANNVGRGVAPDQEKLTLQVPPGESILLMKIVNTGGSAGFYFKKTAELVNGISRDIGLILEVATKSRTQEQQALLRRHYRQQHSQTWQQHNDRKNKLEQERNGLQGIDVMVMDELPAEQRRKTSILARGIYNKPLAEVTSGTPAFLPPLTDESPPNRLALARWLVDPANPLTARVTVNRYWQMLFGRGLVETSEDFGRQAAQPSHPLLLDWLATRFIADGWDVKGMLKRIVMSATYRQSSVQLAAEGVGTDPRNRLLSRGARYRMPSWMLRDQALALGELLVDRMGGPPVRPYQPEGVWAEATFNKIRYRPDKGEALNRRSLYIFWRRIIGPTMLFDAAKRQACEVKPNRTNTPLHALTTLNETTFIEASRAMAEAIMKPAQLSPQERITRAFRRATARAPEAGELELLVERWNWVRDKFTEQPEQARKLLDVGQSPRDQALDPVEQASYTVICSVLMNLDEVLTRE